MRSARRQPGEPHVEDRPERDEDREGDDPEPVAELAVAERVFDVDAETGDVIVAIHATLPVNAPVMFAVQVLVPVVVAPTLWCGMAEHHMAFGGTFTFDIPTYMAVLAEALVAALNPQLATMARSQLASPASDPAARRSSSPLRASSSHPRSCTCLRKATL